MHTHVHKPTTVSYSFLVVLTICRCLCLSHSFSNINTLLFRSQSISFYNALSLSLFLFPFCFLSNHGSSLFLTLSPFLVLMLTFNVGVNFLSAYLSLSLNRPSKKAEKWLNVSSWRWLFPGKNSWVSFVWMHLKFPLSQRHVAEKQTD